MLTVGDEIIINESAEDFYTFSKPGSTGVIVETTPESVRVRFNYLVKPYKGLEVSIWWIDLDHVSPLKIYTPQEKVCLKIKQMEERRKNVSMYI